MDNVQVSLSQRTLDRLQRVAARTGNDISTLLNEIVEQYAADERLRQIDREQEAYQAQHTRLLDLYAGQYIAMRQGQVIDHDEDSEALWKRVRSRWGDEPILITPVLEKPLQAIILRSPHLVESTA